MGWPKGVPLRRQLFDVQMAIIAAADSSISTAALAASLGKPYFTVAHARQRMRRMGGWLCEVRVVACAECGAHPGCEAARAARSSRARRGCGPCGLSSLPRCGRLRSPSCMRPMHATTPSRWSGQTTRVPGGPSLRIQYILEHAKTPAREVALALGRTLWAVRGRRVHLRRELKPPKVQGRPTQGARDRPPRSPHHGGFPPRPE
jgi:hypothetical protein